ncbi:YkyB family protein [Kurthia sibirica]|uniref:YkyB-like protein n=1 Tax=Kurthia sibirica TaxID=202750 RepID=A0A2U3AQC3_9BACL|nr:YkyB family protein [Kurthia sibirica]PWI26743.1 hypothetical protein DEX24_00125 [Kurthia sibirica]GEK32727.1 hypothetical protein KSI01_02600 [Kurthia sibirica]
MAEKYNVELLAQAICSVNKHAKTAPDNKGLYTLKKEAINKLLHLKLAKRVGLHFVDHPRFSQQQSSVLISCANYYFHTLPKKEDFKLLKHLGHLDKNYRNPIERMALSRAKTILNEFLAESSIDRSSPVVSDKILPPKPKKRKPYLKDTSYFYGH